MKTNIPKIKVEQRRKSVLDNLIILLFVHPSNSCSLLEIFNSTFRIILFNMLAGNDGK